MRTRRRTLVRGVNSSKLWGYERIHFTPLVLQNRGARAGFLKCVVASRHCRKRTVAVALLVWTLCTSMSLTRPEPQADVGKAPRFGAIVDRELFALSNVVHDAETSLHTISTRVR